jgi:hypothetical protein
VALDGTPESETFEQRQSRAPESHHRRERPATGGRREHRIETRTVEKSGGGRGTDPVADDQNLSVADGAVVTAGGGVWRVVGRPWETTVRHRFTAARRRRISIRDCRFGATGAADVPLDPFRAAVS